MAQRKNASASDIMSRMRDTASRDRAEVENASDQTSDSVPSNNPAESAATNESTEAGRGASSKRVGGGTVRFTIDLPQNQHRFLKQRALEENVRAASVVRELLTLLEEDAGVAEAIHERLQSLEA